MSLVQERLQLGVPLPFNIRDHDQTLLLARGQRVQTSEQLQALLERGALVDIDELLSPADRIRRASAAELPGLWTHCLGQVNETLRNAHDEGFRDALESAATPVLALVERDPDLAIFQVLRQPGNQHLEYGLNHSTHAAITAWLVAQRLGWSAADAQRAFKVALTMNISMLELQGQLAVQPTPPTDEQRAAIEAHPHFSRVMLEMAGVADTDWLDAVGDHHEAPDGSGYPAGRQTVGELADLVRRADIYTAKLSPRAGRNAIAADRAGRQMFMQEPGHPMVAALVKEFGVYPPGCFVRLASGETGMVVRRGVSVAAPIVAMLGTRNGTKVGQPERRDTSQKAHAVQSVLEGPPTEVPPSVLLAMLAC
ncbi:MAG TPA: HD domain-containing phosphohydrolase [Aquabacterium sp.]|nr:HD domain-containing phosphohydrolase [Aquabacterium sp.]HQC96680.1 HD domain-containing phosphohydrolase [Aquabacterium sp.]